VKQLKLMLMI